MFWNKIYNEEIIDKINFLHNIKLFEGIRKKDIIYILENLQERKYLKGETIFAQNDIGRALFIIYKGKVGIYRYDEVEKKNVLLSEVIEGEFFGEMALLEEMPRTASAIALEDTVIFMLFKNKLQSIMYSKAKIGVSIIYHLAEILSARLRSYMEK